MATTQTVCVETHDAELISLCQHFNGLQDLWLSHFPGGANAVQTDNERGKLLRPIEAKQDLLLDRICDLKAHTQEGLCARVHMLAKWHQDIPGLLSSGYWDERMLGFLLRNAKEMTA